MLVFAFNHDHAYMGIHMCSHMHMCRCTGMGMRQMDHRYSGSSVVLWSVLHCRQKRLLCLCKSDLRIPTCPVAVACAFCCCG